MALAVGLLGAVSSGLLAQTSIPASLKATGVDTNKPGYLVRTYQAEGIDHSGLNATVERLLDGALGPNVANLADPKYPYDASLGAFVVNQPLNFRGDAGEGSDNGLLVGPDFPDATIPGLPGTSGSLEQAAAEAIAFLEFPAPGTYELAVGSDDSFKLTVGTNPRDRFATVLRQFNGERSMAETRVILVNIAEAGVYPFRCLWANRLGASGWEWYVYDNGAVVAIGDATNRVKSYFSGTLRPYVASIFPESGAQGVALDANVTVSLRDDSVAVDGSSIKLTLAAGTTAVPGSLNVTKEGTKTTVTLDPSANLEAGKAYTATLVFADQGTPAVTRTNTWSFTASAALVSANAAIPAGQVDKAKTGFKMFVHQLAGDVFENEALLRNIRDQLGGFRGDNTADLAAAGPDGAFLLNTPDNSLINFNNFYEVVEKGGFNTTNGFPDVAFPGTPGSGGIDWTADNIATDTTALIEFPRAGSYTLGVRAWDSFSVSIGDGVRSPKDLFSTVLGEYDGDAPGNYLFSFFVPAPGFYPVRLIHTIGIKQGDLEFISADADGSNVKLVNAVGGLKAYQPQGTWPAYVLKVTPGVNITGIQDFTTTDVLPNAAVTAIIEDDGTTVEPGNVSLKVDGQGTSTATKSGKRTTVTFTKPSDFEPNSSHTATLVYTDSAGTTVTNEWEFDIVATFTADATLSYPPGSGDAAKRGFNVRVSKLSIGFVSGESGSVTKSEGILNGNLFGGAEDVNLDDTTYPRAGDTWEAQTVNFGTGDLGRIPGNTVAPGVPGKSGHSDHFAAEAEAYIEFPKAGFYQFGVHTASGSPRIMQQEAQSHAYGNVEIIEPLALNGTRVAMSATRTSIGSGFGVDLPTNPIVAKAVVADPLLANTALNNAADVSNSIVIIQRGVVAFGIKAAAAKAAGAKAVIIFNDASGDRANRPPIFMGGVAEGVNIPCLFVNFRDGTNLVALANAGGLVLGLQDNPAQQALDPNDGYTGGWTYAVSVPAPGLYPFRFVCGSGNGSSYSMEWTSVKANGEHVLLNSPDDPEALKTYRAVKTAPSLGSPILVDQARGIVDINWTGNGTLLRSDSIGGPYTPVNTGGSRPAKSNGGDQRFYRLQAN